MKTLGITLYCLLVALLFYLLLNWLLPFAMEDFKGFWGFQFSQLAIWPLTLLSSAIAAGVAIPVYLVKEDKGYIVNVINIITMLISFGFSICIPWQLYEDYNLWNILISLELSISILIIYGVNIFMTFNGID